MASVRPGAARRAPGMIRAAVPRMRIILAPRMRGREKKLLPPFTGGGREGGNPPEDRRQMKEGRPEAAFHGSLTHGSAKRRCDEPA